MARSGGDGAVCLTDRPRPPPGIRRVENRTSQPARSALRPTGAVADFLLGGKAEVVLVRGPLLVETGRSDDHARSYLQCWANLTGTERPAPRPADSSSSSEGRSFLAQRSGGHRALRESVRLAALPLARSAPLPASPLPDVSGGIL